jgi:DNA-binding transcriptional ArsR family regulator
MSEAVKAAAHPTRRDVLKALEKGARTTVELEEATGESRYHLYHHLAVLEEAGLVRSEIEGKAKVFTLLKTKKPDGVYLDFRREDPDEVHKFEVLREALEAVAGDEVPQLEKITRIRLMLSYPWSADEDG